jgi:hypothetical protein
MSAYLMPSYISYEMVEAQIYQAGIKVILDGDYKQNGILLEQVNTYLARGEQYIVQTFLSNDFEIPLITLDGQPFQQLVNNPTWYQSTYVPLTQLFVASGLFNLFKNFYSTGGTSNGGALMQAQADIINAFSNQYFRLNRASNPKLVNVFIGLKKSANTQNRQSSACLVPPIPTGFDQDMMNIESVPNFRYGFNI